MRITLALSDDVIHAVQVYARDNRLSMGQAASELITRGFRYQLRTGERNGIPVFEAPDEFPVITTKRVRQLLEVE